MYRSRNPDREDPAHRGHPGVRHGDSRRPLSRRRPRARPPVALRAIGWRATTNDGRGGTTDSDAVPTGDLVARARELASAGRRRLLGLTGPPGAGKSTLAARLCEALGPLAVRVPLDGFHLSNPVLAELGLSNRKGAPQTFDLGGFLSLLGRLRDATEQVVYAPDFFRELEEAIAGAVPVRQRVPLVIVEGNYLLVDEGPWSQVAAYFDEIWYLELDDAIRLQRLVRRHEQHGRTAEQARSWIAGNDELNAATVARYRGRAGVIVRLP